MTKFWVKQKVWSTREQRITAHQHASQWPQACKLFYAPAPSTPSPYLRATHAHARKHTQRSHAPTSFTALLRARRSSALSPFCRAVVAIEKATDAASSPSLPLPLPPLLLQLASGPLSAWGACASALPSSSGMLHPARPAARGAGP